jgi:hypothetical protein
MDTAKSKIAIILRGPPAVGKSQVARAIQQRHCQSRRISLDDGWGPPCSFRYQSGPARYQDLSQATEPILLIELGCGAPVDLSFPGATQAAHEWISVLRSSGRTLFPFLLWVNWDQAVKNILTRHENDGLAKLGIFWNFIGLYSLYEHAHPTVTLPQLPDFAEVKILTAHRSFADIASEILCRAGLES